MQNRLIIWVFIVLMTLACLYQLSFTWIVRGVEADAESFAQGDLKEQQAYLDSMSAEEVYPVFGFTYADCKKRELNLGLDLKGGMNVILEVSVEDVIRGLAENNANDAKFLAAIEEARRLQGTTSNVEFVKLFTQSFENLYPEGRLIDIFYNLGTKDRLADAANPAKSIQESNTLVAEYLESESESAFERSFEVLRTRVNLFGVAQPNIQQLEGDRILVELPGVKNKERVRQLLQGTAQLEFWETYENNEIGNSWDRINTKLRVLLSGSDEVEQDSVSIEADTTMATISSPEGEVEEAEELSIETEEEVAEESTPSLIDELEEDTTLDVSTAGSNQIDEETRKNNPLYAIFQPSIFKNDEGNWEFGRGPVVGFSAIKDTAKLNEYLKKPEVRAMLPSKLKLLWTAKPYDDEGRFLQLLAIKMNKSDNRAQLSGEVIVDAYQSYSQFGSSPEITMKMNAFGAKTWAALTRDNIGRSIAIVLDNYVYSFPTVQGEIPGGISVISGQFEIEEAQLIANILKAGKLPAPARIIQETVVGPSLGQEAIDSGLRSFLIALVIVLIYMIVYYNKAGIASNVALLANLFFIIGVLASTNIALTLPGIAGIVLTIGMSVDANVLIFERIREEITAGKGIRLAVTDGYNMAYSSIIDANVTTLLTGMILWYFGTGPVEGFAKTLVIGIITSLFSAIFITRLIFTWMMDNNRKMTFSTKMTEGAFKNMNIGFISKRKVYYAISGLIIAGGLFSLFTRGLNYGIDFKGGRYYIVRFDESVGGNDVRDALKGVFESAPEVKQIGESGQLKITTDFMIDSEDPNTANIVRAKLDEGLATLEGQPSYEVMGSENVGPTIADDIKNSAFWSIVFALLIIFIYILMRFRKWQFGLGALLAIFHDVLVVLSVFSILYGVMPFSLEIDQAFIAAILTVVGYSINDTVVVFDRIREYLNQYRKREMNEVVNSALNSTLSRTFNTSLSTIFVLLMIFVFGGEVIQGFAFALLIGVIVGTYSSLCIATPIVIDFSKTVDKVRSRK